VAQGVVADALDLAAQLAWQRSPGGYGLNRWQFGFAQRCLDSPDPEAEAFDFEAKRDESLHNRGR
jgi:hypothetical protein